MFALFIAVLQFHQGQSQGQIQSSSVPGEGAFFGQATSNPIPINMSEVKRSLSWQNSPGFPGQAVSKDDYYYNTGRIGTSLGVEQRRVVILVPVSC